MSYGGDISEVPDGEYENYFDQLKYIILDKKTDQRHPINILDYLSLLFDWEKLKEVVHFLFGPGAMWLLIPFTVYVICVLNFIAVFIAAVDGITSKSLSKGIIRGIKYIISFIYRSSRVGDRGGGGEGSMSSSRWNKIMSGLFKLLHIIGFGVLLIIPFISAGAAYAIDGQRRCYENPYDEECSLLTYPLPYRRPRYEMMDPADRDPVCGCGDPDEAGHDGCCDYGQGTCLELCASGGMREGSEAPCWAEDHCGCSGCRARNTYDGE